MDVAALNLSVDSSEVVKAAANLDKFAASADRAAASGAKLSSGGNTAKLAADYARAARAADQTSSAVAKATAMVAAANAHVVTYRNHLQGIVTASGQASAAQATLATAVSRTSMATQQSDAHVIAYRNNLERLAAANKVAAASSGTAATGVAAVGTAGRATGAIVSGLAGILGGLVGIIIGSVITALISMVSKLWESDEAMKAVTVASDNLGSAQSVLGEMFDLSTGKIKNNTEAIRGNIYMQMIAMQQRQIIARTEADQALTESGAGRTTAMGRFVERVTGGVGSSFVEKVIAQQESRGRNLEKLVEGVSAGMPLEAAGAELDRKAMGDEKYFAAMGALNKAYESFTAGRAARLMEGVLGGGGLPDEFLKPGAAKKPPKGRGGKTDAEKLAELIRNAQAEITIEQNRSKAVQMSAEAAAELEQRTKLLNAAASAGLKITPALTEQVGKLAAAYADAKIAADVTEVTKGVTDDIDKQRAAIADEIKLIGLRGDAYARARREMEAQKKLSDGLPKGAIAVTGTLTGGLSDDIEASDRAKRIDKIRKDAEDSAYAMDLERRAIGLTGAAALEYAYISERLIEAKRAGIELSPAEVAAINAAGKAYADQRYAIDQQAQALADSREVTRGFFADWINGVREGGNLFKAFADSVVNSLNRIIDKLLDRTLNSFLDSMFSGGSGGGFLGSLFGGSKGLTGMGPTGGAFGGSSTKYLNAASSAKASFAKGGAFTNQIVNTPTLFRFANGAALGEMGENGPEGILPLKRGPNGALGVQAHGSGSRKAEINIKQDFHMEGVMTPNDVASMVRQGAASAVQEVKRNLDAYLREWDIDGAVSS